MELLREMRESTVAYATVRSADLSRFDSRYPLTFFPGKKEVACPPPQAQETGVLLVLGQSNAANYGQRKFTTQYPQNVVNYFNGRCYVASSPLLGATGHGGEFITPLADELIATGTYKHIVIIAAAVGGASISRWGRHGDLNKSLIARVKKVQQEFPITEVIWHQGETDTVYITDPKVYAASFRSLVDTLTEQSVTAPIFISIATRWCHAKDRWNAVNPVASAQATLIDNKRIFLGVDTDTLVDLKDRFDTCHFTERGQLKTAKALADSIRGAKHSAIRHRFARTELYRGLHQREHKWSFWELFKQS
jgi:hypothetical protein